MSNGSDKLLVRAEDKSEAARQETADVDAALVELGKVSDTQGGWFGAKTDSGAGLTWT
ncbi:MAG TPA: hypothetical protein VGN43_20655 [Steroidobacteraceae bacterium]|jgi:hypothetical protein|nr:hypothetical protein [Steroidobacteraceae bacterium]